jgi:hypothetical protein
MRRAASKALGLLFAVLALGAGLRCGYDDSPADAPDAGAPDSGTGSADGGTCLTAIDCNDGNACTVDACVQGLCVHTPIAGCDAGRP